MQELAGMGLEECSTATEDRGSVGSKLGPT